MEKEPHTRKETRGLSYIADPTSVLLQFLKREHGLKPRREFQLGRLAMALELLTVIKTLEDELVPMLVMRRMEIISVLETFLLEQDLDERAKDWYDALNLWRQPSFVREPSPGQIVLSVPLDDGDPSSPLEELEHEPAPYASTRALLDERQSRDLPSGESDEQPDAISPATRSELDESVSHSPEDLAEFLRQSRIHRGTQH